MHIPYIRRDELMASQTFQRVADSMARFIVVLTALFLGSLAGVAGGALVGLGLSALGIRHKQGRGNAE